MAEALDDELADADLEDVLEGMVAAGAALVEQHERASESLEQALVQLDRHGGAKREAFAREHVADALEALRGDG